MMIIKEPAPKTIPHCSNASVVTWKVLLKAGTKIVIANNTAEAKTAMLKYLLLNVSLEKIVPWIDLELKAWNNWITPRVAYATHQHESELTIHGMDS